MKRVAVFAEGAELIGITLISSSLRVELAMGSDRCRRGIERVPEVFDNLCAQLVAIRQAGLPKRIAGKAARCIGTAKLAATEAFVG